MTEERTKRKLSAIFSADVKGYSRLMEEDEISTVQTLKAYRKLLTSLIQDYRGRVVDSPGDNVLAEFESAVDAVQCAVDIQKELKTQNESLPEDKRLEFRIGINIGDVVQDGGRIYGDGVNIAARIENIADPGGICVSRNTYDHIKKKLNLGYEYLGEHEVKNISESVRAYRVLLAPEDIGKHIGEKKSLITKRWHWVAAAAGVILVVAIVVGIWQFYIRHPSVEPASMEKMAYPLPDKPSIAVLPFENLSGDPEQEYIADGITENIITGLSQIPDMFVIARNSVFTYKGKPVKIQQVGEELGVRYVLEGSVQKSGDRLRLTAQLIDAIEGHHLWAERYDRQLKDLFTLQDEVTMKIIDAMQVKLTVGESPIFSGTDNFEAWSHIVRGLGFLNRGTKEDILRARKHFEQAIKIDPDYAHAWTHLALTHCLEVSIGVSKSPPESIKQALNLTQKSSALGGVQAYIHVAMNWIYRLQGQYDKAIAEGERAVALEPNSARSHIFLAIVLHYARRPEEAIVHAKKAMRLAPYYQAWFLPHLAGPYEMVGRYEEAIATWKQLLDRALRGEFPPIYAHERLALNYARLDRMEEARAHAAKIMEIKPDYTVEFYRRTTSYKDQKYLDSLVALLIKAGLPEHPPLKLPDKPSIAVLPFVNMSGDPEQEYFSDGMTEEIITALSKTPKLFVIARHSTFTYKGKSVKIQHIGRELGVRYVLEGSVRKAGDKVRITAQLIDAETEKHLWAERYDRDLKDVFAIQDEITLEIIKAMQVELTEGEQARVTGRGTKNLDAYFKTLQADELWQDMTKERNIKFRQLAMEAISLDPQYGYPYAILSWSHMLDVWHQTSESPKESMRLASESIQKALALDNSDHRIHEALSNLYVMQGKHDEAIASAQRALELCPGGVGAYQALGLALVYACKYSEAIPFREQAIKLDPFPDGGSYRILGEAYTGAERYEEAIQLYRKALQLSPNSVSAYFGLVRTYARLGRKEKARAAAAELLKVNPKFSLDWSAKMSLKITAAECHSAIYDDIELLRKADVGLK